MPAGSPPATIPATETHFADASFRRGPVGSDSLKTWCRFEAKVTQHTNHASCAGAVLVSKQLDGGFYVNTSRHRNACLPARPRIGLYEMAHFSL
jgi:hypothetical protein